MADQTPQKYHQPATRGTWVQTERAGHEAWAELIKRNPKAAQLLHKLVANMDEKGALVASHKLLAQLCDVSIMTIRRALAVLVEQNFIQTVRVGSERGGVLAYIINSRIAWADSRENLKYATFSAKVMVTSSEHTDALDGPELKQTPILGPGELQLPHGPSVPPPAQDSLETMLPNLPAVQKGEQMDLIS
ncbi:hypothetical protein P2W50_31275 [Pseudomonas protegens]|uniref:DeoR family transcriptional regulator n=1 Tax=Pseudomonas protegens TaxID=380021 RepID=UPI0023EC42AB|nr:hypothetical protein [Pseudomonas protegens]MDF4211135.1 hypothetical protein [Pseudomonas protegens]